MQSLTNYFIVAVTSEAIGNVRDIIEDIEKSEGGKAAKAAKMASRNSSSLVVDVHLTPEQQERNVV